jgi:hypothetical protein
MEASYRLIKTFRTWPKDTWRRGSAFIACLQTILTDPSTEAWDLTLFSGHLQPTLLSFPPPPQPLCILNSEFHSSFLSHLVFLCSVRRLLVTASVVPSSLILVTLMEAVSSSETSVLQEPHGVTSQMMPFFMEWITYSATVLYREPH